MLGDDRILADNVDVIVGAPTYLRQWNWGAFLLPQFWPLTHGLAWLAVAEWAGSRECLRSVRSRQFPSFGASWSPCESSLV